MRPDRPADAAPRSFADLQQLASWFHSSLTRPSLHVERLVERLGSTAIPLLGRQLASGEPRRREAARAALARLAASPCRARVIAELRRIIEGNAGDAGKVSALGLLAELGERGVARFADPSGIQRSSALALASQLQAPGDVAAAVDLMVGQLADADLVQLVAVMAEAAPEPAHRVAAELCARLDVAIDLRERIADVALAPAAPVAPARAMRPTHVHVLVDHGPSADEAHSIVIACRKVSGERRWRRWAVMLAGSRIADCLHEEASHELDAAALLPGLVADGYRVISTAFDDAKQRIAAAARATGDRLPRAYYVGRDLLDLGDAHLPPHVSPLGRATELIAAGNFARARLVLARSTDSGDSAESADVAAATAACLLAQDRPSEAVPLLARACTLEPAWPLHHWNLAAACHAIGDAAVCHQALRRFIATSAEPTGLVGDPDQPARVAQALRLVAELERTARLRASR